MDLAEHIDYLSGLGGDTEGDAGGLLDAGGDLPPFLRALLVADGTVTVLLRAYFDEAINVRTIEQSLVTLDEALPLLRLEPASDAFARQVVLLGAESGREYARATSILNPAVLPEPLFQALIEEHVGMGEVLRNAARGSFRQVLDIRSRGTVMERTYLVYLEGWPAILITESFNVAAF